MRLSRREVLAAGAMLAGSLWVPATAASGRSLTPILEYTDWLGERPTAESLRDRVVLLDVFTFACWNCQNVTPNLRALHRAKSASDLIIIGIHTPETPYERDRNNVIANLKKLGITWPVAVDNNQRLWAAYNIEYWPTQMIFDRGGRLRTTIVGDSQDAEVNAAVNSLTRAG